MDVLSVAKDIEHKIKLLEKGRDGLQALAIDKAHAIAEYDKELRIAILKLKDEGKLPATLIEKVAKGDCHKERGDKELAKALYKIQIVKMSAVEAELNGFQSINRYLAVT